ncbi:hypothetical protein GGR54DRAFT_79691 [Hypoxylon sp. NC1633]|nr:hypothetical protein GGR54DRAFT_79691 [Hypoxylon sp. NC1633]
MTAPDMEVKSLDLAARAIDLTTTLLKATSSTGSLLKGAWEIGQWLGREKLNQYELLDCMEKAKGLVYANKNGQGFFDDIIRGLDTRPVGPLFLQQSGSLGRLMAGDPNLSWVVSTVACLFQHHRNEDFVTDALTAFIMTSHRSREHGGVSAGDSFTYDPEQTRLRAVAKKIVSSVWFNVVNTGCDTISLPEELRSVCPRGHDLDPGDFGVVINTIQVRCASKAILKISHLLQDVLLWLLLHYDGTIIVTSGGHIYYRADLGNPKRELEVHVVSICPEDGSCHGGTGRESYEILHHVSGKFEEFLRGYSFSDSFDTPSRPGTRQKLYDIPRLYPNDSKMWRRDLQIQVERSAQTIMKWLLGVQLHRQVGFSSPGFSAILSGQTAPEVSGDQMTISLALRRVPAIINLDWGKSPSSPVVFLDIPFLEVDHRYSKSSGFSTDISKWDTEFQLAVVLTCFPILQNLLREVSTECLCSDCSHSKRRSLLKTSPEDKRNTRTVMDTPKSGCLKRLALEDVFLLLAHGVADGFGVSDVSSVSDITPIIRGTTKLLVELAHAKQVQWDTWFTVASCVYLGCQFQLPVREDHPAFGGTSFAAIQFGNLATVAPWLDLTQKLDSRGCFGLTASRGRLGVITRNDQDVQFRSVEENLAIIETENTEDTTSFCSRNKKASTLVDHRLHVEIDKSPIESDVILYQVDDKFYRLLLRIKTQTHWRVVDPSDALSAVIRMLPSASCQHIDDVPEMSPSPAMIYTMDEVVGRWPEAIQTHVSTAPTTGNDGTALKTGTMHLTYVLDTHHKKNVALALSVCPTTVPNYPELACTTCTFSHAWQMERDHLRDGESGDPTNRYIVNLLPELAERDGSGRRRLLEGPTK